MIECTKCNSIDVKCLRIYEFFDFYECLNCKSIFSSRIKECCRNPFPIVVIEYYSNNTLTKLFNQCLNCGGAFRKDNFPRKTHSELIKSEFSITNFDNWNKKRNDENSIITEQFEVYRKSKFYNYHKYLKSTEWKILRDKVVERDNGICLYCKTKPAQEVHHKHYKTIYKESLDDLESVCSDCHRVIHKSFFDEVLKGH